MRVLLLALTILVATAASAQKAMPTPAARAAADDVCETGTARADLDLVGVRAALYTIGNLFWRGSGAVYEVPKGSGKTAVFSAGIWIGGKVDGDLRFAGSTYGPWEYWPGPLDADATTTPDRCADYDRIWTVTTADLDAYHATGTATDDLADWPVGVGAPFYVDTDGDNRQSDAEPTVSLDLGDAGYGTKTLDLTAGERPVIFGRQTAWWVVNDAGGAHAWSQEEPLGIEVRATAWLLGGLANQELNESTFYRYEIINRSAEVVEETYFGLYADADLGDPTDDYIGSDSTRSMLYVYNGDADDGGPDGYGVPPALGIDILSGGTATIYMVGGGTVTSDPNRGAEAYTFMQALWKDGTPLRVGGDGYNTDGPVTRWAFSGPPPAFWSEYDADGSGRANTPADRRAMVSARIGRLDPGARTTVDLGFLFAQGLDQIDSVYEVFEVSDLAQSLYDAGALTALVEDPPPPATAPVLLAPEDGADLPSGPVTFRWSAVAQATAYTLELDADPAFPAPWRIFVTGTQAEVPADSIPAGLTGPVYWRVRPETLGAQGQASEASSFTPFRFVDPFASFEVVANAAGPLAPPQPGAAAFAGFPTPDGANPTSAQQTDGARWLFSAGGGDGTYADFTSRALRGDNASRLTGAGFEMRFTGSSLAYRRYEDDALMTVPFEIWSLGLSDGPADDVRLITAILDNPNDDGGNGIYDLSTQDSPISGGANDPETDWTYWYEPTDRTPGEAGYLAWEAGAATNPRAHGPELLAHTTLVGWNLGTAPPYAPALPEVGTVFRIVASDPLAPTADTSTPERPGLSLQVGPNPVRERAAATYTLLSAGDVRLVVVDVLGREVAVLASGPRASGEHRAEVDAARLAAGLYVVVLDAGGQRVGRAITVVR